MAVADSYKAGSDAWTPAEELQFRPVIDRIIGRMQRQDWPWFSRLQRPSLRQRLLACHMADAEPRSLLR